MRSYAGFLKIFGPRNLKLSPSLSYFLLIFHGARMSWYMFQRLQFWATVLTIRVRIQLRLLNSYVGDPKAILWDQFYSYVRVNEDIISPAIALLGTHILHLELLSYHLTWEPSLRHIRHSSKPISALVSCPLPQFLRTDLSFPGLASYPVLRLDSILAVSSNVTFPVGPVRASGFSFLVLCLCDPC